MALERIEEVHQSLFNRKIEAYLKGRGRENILEKDSAKDENITVKGLCNGASLLLLENLFYDCLNRYYEQDPSQPKKSLEELLDNVLDDFFKEIEAIINTDDKLLNPPIYQQKLGDRTLDEYKKAQQKLDHAIESKKLKITPLGKPDDDYYLHLVKLAEEQTFLKPEEAQVLRDAHIPDIPLFESFINQIFLFQTGNEETFSLPQNDVAGKMRQLTAKIPFHI